MKRPWTIQLGYAAYFGATVTVEAPSLEDAIPLAIREADESGSLEEHRPRRRPPRRRRVRGRRRAPLGRTAVGAPHPGPFHRTGRTARRDPHHPRPAREHRGLGRHRPASLRRTCGHCHHGGHRPPAAPGHRRHGDGGAPGRRPRPAGTRAPDRAAVGEGRERCAAAAAAPHRPHARHRHLVTCVRDSGGRRRCGLRGSARCGRWGVGTRAVPGVNHADTVARVACASEAERRGPRRPQGAVRGKGYCRRRVRLDSLSGVDLYS